MKEPQISSDDAAWARRRLAMLLAQEPAAPRPIAVVPLGEMAEAAALALADRLRRGGLRVELGFRGNLKRRLEQANRRHARAAIILGADEIARGAVALKDLDSGAQTEVSLADLDGRLAQYR